MQAYRNVRSTGENDIGTILLSIASDLEAFDFHDTFTGNFEVCTRALLYMHAKRQLNASSSDTRLHRAGRK
jgi:hypothetical protein